MFKWREVFFIVKKVKARLFLAPLSLEVGQARKAGSKGSLLLDI
jgi:hypothetical protein